MITGTYAGVLDDRELADASGTENNFRFAEVFSVNANAGQPKVDICHNGNTITVAQPAVINAHLAHGDTIGSCEGVGGEGGTTPDEADSGKFTIGYNVPASKIDGAGYKIDWNNGNMITFATERPPYMDGAATSPHESWNIDVKMDDGSESDGRVLTANGYSDQDCVTEGAGYNFSAGKIVCQMHFWFE